MSKIKNGGLDQYGAEPFEQQQFGTCDVEGVKLRINLIKPKREEQEAKIQRRSVQLQ